MSITFISVITERELYGNSAFNVVAFSESSGLLEVHDNLLQAADLIQSRYLYASFLLEASPASDRGAIEAIENVFAVDSARDLFCVPYAKRMLLPDAAFAITNFSTYTKLFTTLCGDSEVIDLDDVWEDCYENHGLLTFRLILT